MCRVSADEAHRIVGRFLPPITNFTVTIPPNSNHDRNQSNSKTHSLCSFHVGGQASAENLQNWPTNSSSTESPAGRRNWAAHGSSSRLHNPNTCRNRFVVPYHSGRPNSSERPTIRKRSRSINWRRFRRRPRRESPPPPPAALVADRPPRPTSPRPGGKAEFPALRPACGRSHAGKFRPAQQLIPPATWAT